MEFRGYDTHPVRRDTHSAHRHAWERLSQPGCHWTGAERVAIAAQARSAQTERGLLPADESRPTRPTEPLSAAASEAARTVAVDARGLDRAWSRRIADDLGEDGYVELVAVVVQTTAVDVFAAALGVPLEPLPSPQSGAPDPALAAADDALGEIGAFVPMLRDFPGPNVGRALSLVPQDNRSFFALVASMYALEDFGELVWDRPLTRPQVELVASRVSALNECFY